MNGKKPRILLVQPTTVHLDGTPHKTRWRLIMGLMIPLMAGLTPDDYDVTLCDERLEDIDFDGGWDLVGMTTTIGASLRAYQLGDEFRKRGIPVVFGGFHATLQTEEALQHCDAVVKGEADLVWPELLQDWRDGKLKTDLQSRQAARSEEPAAPAPRAAQAQSLPVQGGAGAGQPRMPLSMLVLRDSGVLRRRVSDPADRGHRRGDQAGHQDYRLQALPVHRRSDHRQAQVRARAVQGARAAQHPLLVPVDDQLESRRRVAGAGGQGRRLPRQHRRRIDQPGQPAVDEQDSESRGPLQEAAQEARKIRDLLFAQLPVRAGRGPSAEFSTTRSSSCTRSRRPRRSSTPSRRAWAPRCARSSRTRAA